MSGLYSTDAKSFDQTLDLQKEFDAYSNFTFGTTTRKLTKEPHNDSLKYIYQTIKNGEIVETEIITVKKQ